MPDRIANPAIELVQRMGIDSLRAEITWFESARAYAAADGPRRSNHRRFENRCADGIAIAPLAVHE